MSTIPDDFDVDYIADLIDRVNNGGTLTEEEQEYWYDNVYSKDK